MKSIFILAIIFLVIIIKASAQSAGDYQSIANGNWNDPTKWQKFDGVNWISTNTYPGQNPGTAMVNISLETQIKITQTVPYPIPNLFINADYNELLSPGILIFSSDVAVALTVTERVDLYGSLIVENQNGAKTHTLFVGGTFASVRTDAIFQGINQDDKLCVTFNGNNDIFSLTELNFEDVAFDCARMTIWTPIHINGRATFINGIVSLDCEEFLPEYFICGSINFHDGATCTGASDASYVYGVVYKTGDDPFTFPIGDGGLFSPLTISAPVGQAEILGAGYTRSVEPSSITAPGLFSVSSCEQWSLVHLAGNSLLAPINYPLSITVGWDANSGCGSPPYISDMASVTLAHFSYASLTWDNHGGMATGTTGNGSITWSGEIIPGGFTFGNLGTGCDAPSGLATLDITTNSASLSWSGSPATVSYDVDYKDFYSYNWTSAATATPSTSITLSGLNQSVTYDWRVRGNCSSGSSSYKQTRFTTLAPCNIPSGLSTINITGNSATLNWGAVANAINYDVHYTLSSSPSSWTPAATGISSLSFNLTGLSPVTAYSWRVRANCGALGSGNFAESGFMTTACMDNYEPNNTSSQARTINLGVTISALISSGNDVDWYKVTTPNSSINSFRVILSNLPEDYDLYIYSKNLSLIGSSTQTGLWNEVVIYNTHARNATYYIKVAGKNGAYNASTCYNLLAFVIANTAPVSNPSGPVHEINENANNPLLYPNPASEFVFLNFNSATEGLVNLQIVNSIGQLVKQQAVNIINGPNLLKIDVNDIRPGMYILRINKGELNLTRKFVIAR